MRDMVLTAEQMRQVRLNQPPLSWPEQEVIFRRNWESLQPQHETLQSSSRRPIAKKGVVGVLKQVS